MRKYRARKLSGLKPASPGWRLMVSLYGLFLPGLSPSLRPSQFPGPRSSCPALPSSPFPSLPPLFLSPPGSFPPQGPLSTSQPLVSSLLPSPLRFPPLPSPLLSLFPSPSLSSSCSPLLPPPFFSAPHPSPLPHALPLLLFPPITGGCKTPSPTPASQGLEDKV